MTQIEQENETASGRGETPAVRRSLPTRERHAVLSGSLGQGNFGDELLLDVFLNKHEDSYKSIMVVGDREPIRLGRDLTRMEYPRLGLGRRFWLGIEDRRRKRRLIERMSPGGESSRDYFWLGGVLGGIVPHIKMRRRELQWSMPFCSRLVFYFGDASEGFRNLDESRRLAKVINANDAWLAVRSAEAASTLESAGVKGPIRVGIDPVLYDQVERYGLPFRRRKEATPTLVINPCVLLIDHDRYVPIWMAAARAAVRLGLKVRWLSLCDPTDLPLCHSLSERLRAEAPHHPQEVLTSEHAVDALEEAAVSVPTRFHGVLFATAAGPPTIAVAYESKIQRLFELLGLDDWMLTKEGAGRATDLDAVVLEMVKAALEGEFRPRYDEFERRVESHRAALAEFVSTLEA